MKKPQSIPVERARKEFADILDDTQHHGGHVEITRRGKRSGIVVPPDWYDTAVAAISENKELRRQLAQAGEAQDG
ncbi:MULTISPECIES: type II toxin-antitoxin system prevent-host-death family antitoxin [unclassified Streptomyces]|uniref:type II toxin-antitoxin system prevent-host-death family antitoxin n=1 Tax=unclassified Streptomyces TaxID=2593676 RepID=UPI002FC86B3C